jgi:hypothetical protein
MILRKVKNRVLLHQVSETLRGDEKVPSLFIHYFDGSV